MKVRVKGMEMEGGSRARDWMEVEVDETLETKLSRADITPVDLSHS